MSALQTKTLWGSFAAAAKSLFNSFDATMQVVDDAVSMASESVELAKLKQTADNLIEAEEYLERVTIDAALRSDGQKKKFEEYCEQFPQRREYLEKTRDSLRAKIEKKQQQNKAK